LTVQQPDNGKKFRAVFTNALWKTATRGVVLSVGLPPVVADTLANETVRAGQHVKFTAAVTGRMDPDVQWQMSTDGGRTWNDIAGATSRTLKFTAHADENADQFRAVVTSAVGQTFSNAATLTVDSHPMVIEQPTHQSVSAGSTAAFTALAEGFPNPTVQWEVRSNGKFVPIDGANSGSYSFTAQLSDRGKQFRAVFTNAFGTAVTRTATLTLS
jgi:hypothetical protein